MGEKGTHEKHLSVLDFEKKERAKEVAELEAEKINLEEKNAAIEEVSDKMLERLEEIESDVQSAQEVLDKTEQDAEKSKQKAQKYEKQFQRLDNISNNIRRYAGEFSRKAEEVLPDADFWNPERVIVRKSTASVSGVKGFTVWTLSGIRQDKGRSRKDSVSL